MQERAQWLEEAMQQYEQSLIRLCFAYLGDLALAEDAVQETFLKAWKGYCAYRGEASEQTWLMRIAINTCKDIRRSAYFRHTDRRTPLESLPEGLTDADVLGLSVENGTLLVNLSARYGEVIRQSDLDQRLMAYSMVNTLCERLNVRRARFFFGGEAVDSLGSALCWSGEFLYHCGLIVP